MRQRPAPKMAEGWVNLDGEGFELDSVLPEQYYEQVAIWTPEQRLQAAVLRDAVRRYRQHKWEALRWFHGPHLVSPFSFLSICDSLGLDADALWRRLQAERKA